MHTAHSYIYLYEFSLFTIHVQKPNEPETLMLLAVCVCVWYSYILTTNQKKDRAIKLGTQRPETEIGFLVCTPFLILSVPKLNGRT